MKFRRETGVLAGLVLFTALETQPLSTQRYVANIGASLLQAPLAADFDLGSSFTMEGWFQGQLG